MNWVWIGSNLGLIGGRILEHLALTAPPIVIGLVLSIPLGYAASRSKVARSILLSVGGILYTIPSIALLVLVPVVLGLAILNPLNLVFALSIYAVAIMVRSAADAFASVSEGRASPRRRRSGSRAGSDSSSSSCRSRFPCCWPASAWSR